MRTLIAVTLILLLVVLFALPVFAQSLPPAPTGLSATATSAQSATVSWTKIPSNSCSGDVDYALRASNAGHVIEAFSAIDANEHQLNSLNTGTYSIEVYSYCYATDEYSASPAKTSVTIDSGNTDPAPTIADNSLGVAQPSSLSASVSSGTVTVTWTSTAGQTAASGYCDVTEYYVEVTDQDYTSVDSDYVTAGTWTSNSLTAGSYIAWLTAYSQECDAWSSWLNSDVVVS